MASHDQYPQEDNVTKEQIPHSFRHGETPHREFDNTPLTDAVEQGLIITPDSPALLMPEKKNNGWKKPLVVGTAILAAIGGGIGIGAKAMGGNEPNTESPTEPSVSGPVTPGAGEEVILSQAQQERAALAPHAADAAMLESEYYNAGGDTVANIDQSLLITNLGTLLDNITYMRETGDFSIMNKTFLSDDEGNYPGASADVDGVKIIYDSNKQNQNQNPDQPVSNIHVAAIEHIETAGFETIKVTAIIFERTFGAPSEVADPVEFESATRIEYTLQGQMAKVGDTGTQEHVWLILSQVPQGAVDFDDLILEDS